MYALRGIGVIYGYNENGLPRSLIYGAMGVTAGAHMMKILAKEPVPLTKPGIVGFALLVGAPLVVGTNFCISHFLGRSLRHVDSSIDK